jgi:hypothetical protein
VSKTGAEWPRTRGIRSGSLVVNGVEPEGVVGAWKGEGEGRIANAPPPETCQLIARNFCNKHDK